MLLFSALPSTSLMLGLNDLIILYYTRDPSLSTSQVLSLAFSISHIGQYLLMCAFWWLVYFSIPLLVDYGWCPRCRCHSLQECLRKESVEQEQELNRVSSYAGLLFDSGCVVFFIPFYSFCVFVSMFGFSFQDFLKQRGMRKTRM